MRLEALDHPKTMDLAARLNVPLPQAIGHLELLWAFTAKKAPRGNVGKWPDGAISMACYWTQGSPQRFLEALLEAGFLDAHAEHRYLIHDWHMHAPRWVRAKLAKEKSTFIGTAEATVVPTAAPTQTPPLQGKGREGKGSTREGSIGGASAPRARDLIAEALASVCQLDLTRLTPSERGRFNKALKGLKSVEATPQQITERAAAYRSRFADCVLTPTGLESNWGKCDPKPPPSVADQAKAAATADLVRRSLEAADRKRMERA